MLPAPAEGESRDTRLFSRKLQPPGGGQRQTPAELPDHGAESGMPKPLFHDKQHLLGRLHHKQPLRLKAHQSERRCEKITMGRDPKDWTMDSRDETANHLRGRSPLLGIRSGAPDLVQGAKCQPSSRQAFIDGFYPEWQRPGSQTRRVGTFEARDAGAQVIEKDGRLFRQMPALLLSNTRSWGEHIENISHKESGIRPLFPASRAIATDSRH